MFFLLPFPPLRKAEPKFGFTFFKGKVEPKFGFTFSTFKKGGAKVWFYLFHL